MKTLSVELQMDIARCALDKVDSERRRQVAEKGYDYAHDDQHGTEELAAAATFFLLPSWLNPDVCIAEGVGLSVTPLREVIGDAAWEGIDRTHGGDFDAEEMLDDRINQLVKGLALGLAELERCMRARELQSMEGAA